MGIVCRVGVGVGVEQNGLIKVVKVGRWLGRLIGWLVGCNWLVLIHSINRGGRSERYGWLSV